jgi:RimJ/RimL family protein N-acetyltransferase
MVKMKMKLESMAKEDLALREAIESDAKMMAELGGANTREQIERAHLRALASVAAGTCWYLKIVTGKSNAGVGYIGVWSSSYRETAINAIGWMVLPKFQGHGLATQAAQETLWLASKEGKFQIMRAFPGISNAASNALCKRIGFEKIEECEVEYQSRTLKCNNWRIQLF